MPGGQPSQIPSYLGSFVLPLCYSSINFSLLPASPPYRPNSPTAPAKQKKKACPDTRFISFYQQLFPHFTINNINRYPTRFVCAF